MAIATNVDCATLTIDNDSEAMPTISGEPDLEPTIEWSGKKAPENLTVKTLTAGDGPEVGADSTIQVNYIGWQWDAGEDFESSFELGAPAAFPINGVITGWRCGLPGAHVGDRLVMAIPPQYAYGTDKSSNHPTGPLVFVVDVLATESMEDLSAGTKDAAEEAAQEVADRGVTVTGELGTAATISVNEGATEPTEYEFFVLARGNGEPITESSTVVTQSATVYWDNSEPYSTWEKGAPETVSAGTDPAIQGFIGVPVGSRVVVLIPGDENSETPAVARVIDLEKLG